MWITRLKQKIKDLGIRFEDAAGVMGMTLNGFNSAVKAESFRFDAILRLAEKYDFSLDELRFEKKSLKVEESASMYKKTVENIQTLQKGDVITYKIYEEMKNNYENRILENKNNYENRIIEMNGQIKFLQNLIETK